jgi:sugar O-acyltransferase (sialic acid O-acetyltransferase NeuD family)
MDDLVIYGTGGFARELHQVVRDVNATGDRWRILGFLDDDPRRHGDRVHDLPVLGDAGWLAARPGVHVAVGIGSPGGRRRVVRAIEDDGCARFATLVHPRAWVGDGVTLGYGSVVTAGCLLTTDLRLGDHVIVNLGCTVGHDAVIEGFATLAPGVNVSGGVRVGEGADVGTGAALIPGVDVGAWSVVGAGSVVVRDVPGGATVVGSPARVVKQRSRPAGVSA